MILERKLLTLHTKDGQTDATIKKLITQARYDLTAIERQ